METKKEIKARELIQFRDCLDSAYEEALERIIAKVLEAFEIETEETFEGFDAISTAWDEAFNFDAFASLIERNFRRGFQAAWEAAEKSKRETEKFKRELESVRLIGGKKNEIDG